MRYFFDRKWHMKNAFHVSNNISMGQKKKNIVVSAELFIFKTFLLLIWQMVLWINLLDRQELLYIWWLNLIIYFQILQQLGWVTFELYFTFNRYWKFSSDSDDKEYNDSTYLEAWIWNTKICKHFNFVDNYQNICHNFTPG